MYVEAPVILIFLEYLSLKAVRPWFTARSSASGSDVQGQALFQRDFAAWVKNHLENLAFRPLTMPLLCADKPLAEGFGRKIPR
ncbi:hypothetical protein CIL02_11380 [Prevotella sp. P3-122]|nr:hypothetical protein CIL02_11380 [Prevotella sp. P3-122]